MNSSRRRKAVSWKAVVIGLGALFVLAGLIAIFGYYRYVKYERVAALHLPNDTALALRIDVEKVVLFDPIRKHLLPLADELGRRERALNPRLMRLKDKTGVALAVDLRELVLARGALNNQWLLLVGGRFSSRGVVDGLAEVLGEEGHAVQRLAPDQVGLASGIGIGQADDGTIIIADTVPRMQSALPSQPTHERLGLPREGAGAFSVEGRLIKPLSALSTYAVPALSDLAYVDSMTGVLSLGDTFTLETRVMLNAAVSDAALEERGRALVKALSQLAPLMVPGAQPSILERAHVTLAEPRTLRVVIDFEREEVERGAQALAAAIRRLPAGR